MTPQLTSKIVEKEVLCVFDKSGHIVMSNRGFREVIGKESNEIEGLEIKEFVAEQEKGKISSIIETLGKGKKNVEILINILDEGKQKLEAQWEVLRGVNNYYAFIKIFKI